jgi:hypothetical protein
MYRRAAKISPERSIEQLTRGGGVERGMSGYSVSGFAPGIGLVELERSAPICSRNIRVHNDSGDGVIFSKLASPRYKRLKSGLGSLPDTKTLQQTLEK